MIHISFAITDTSGRYSALLGCALESLLKNTEEKVCVHVLHDESYSESEKQKIYRLIKAYGQSVKYYTINFSDVIENVYKRQLNKAALVRLFRLYLPELISRDIDKIIYLDADIIVNCDINELWCMELDGCSLGAVIHEGLKIDSLLSASIVEANTSIVDVSKYFNGGVMILDLARIRRKVDLLAESARYFNEHPNARYREQDVLNYLFSRGNDVKLIEGKYNMLVVTRRKAGEIEKGIYHWAYIPFDDIEVYGSNPFDDMIWQYMMETPWQDEMLSYYNDICAEKIEQERDGIINSLLGYLDKDDDALQQEIRQDFYVGWLDIEAVGENCFIDVQNMVQDKKLFRHVSERKYDDRKAISCFCMDGIIKIWLQCDGDGEIRMALRGLLRKGDDGKNLPYWVTYTDFMVNGHNLLAAPAEACYDKPLTVKKEVRSGEAFELEIRWQPSIRTLKAMAN